MHGNTAWLWRNAPNILTLARLGCAALIALYVFDENLSLSDRWVALALFIAGSVTDFLDGWLARKYGLVSVFGKVADPVAYKLLVILFMIFLWHHTPLNIYEVVCGSTICLREATVDAVRWYLRSCSKEIPSSSLGKWKAALQMVALILYGAPLEVPGLQAMQILVISVAAGLTILSAAEYAFPEWLATQAKRFPVVAKTFRQIDSIRGYWA